MIEEELIKKSDTNHQLVEQMADLEIEKAELNNQLTKAKKIIQRLVTKLYKYTRFTDDVLAEAEQFLKESN